MFFLASFQLIALKLNIILCTHANAARPSARFSSLQALGQEEKPSPVGRAGLGPMQHFGVRTAAQPSKGGCRFGWSTEDAVPSQRARLLSNVEARVLCQLRSSLNVWLQHSFFWEGYVIFIRVAAHRHLTYTGRWYLWVPESSCLMLNTQMCFTVAETEISATYHGLAMNQFRYKLNICFPKSPDIKNIKLWLFHALLQTYTFERVGN